MSDEPTKLPSTIGEVIHNEHGTTIHDAEARRFNPHLHASNPNGPKEPQPEHKLPLADILPIALLPSTSFIPKEYQIHLHSQTCAACGTTHEWSCAYAFNSVSPRTGMGKRISHLVPIDRFSYNVPLRHLRIPTRIVPGCHECVPDLSHLPKPQDTAAFKAVVAAHQTAEAKATAKAEKKSSTPKTLDDFL